jgi:hypothetical protein
MRRKSPGLIRALDPSNLHSPDHLSHRQAWLAAARELGRAMADHEFDRLHQKENTYGDVEDGSGVRAFLK